MATLEETIVTGHQPTHNFSGCVEGVRYFSDLLLGHPGASANLYNVRGNAWNIADSAYGTVYNAKDLKDYKINDIVVFDRPGFASDQQRGIPETEQHVGIVTGFAADGTPMISHYTNHNAPFNYEPLNQVTFKQGNKTITKYTPKKVIRLNIDSSTNTPNYKQFNLNQNDNYGVNLNAAIESLQKFDSSKFDLTQDEIKNLQIATLGILGLESSFGGGSRFLLRHMDPKAWNTAKQVKNEEWAVPSIGYGSIKPEFVYQNTTYPDLTEQLKKGQITKQEYYRQTAQRTARTAYITDHAVPSKALAYNFWDIRKNHPQTTMSYTGNLVGWAGLDRRDVGQNIKKDAQLVYTQLVGLHKKYPKLSMKELVAKYRGSKLYKEDSETYDQITSKIKAGTYNPGIINRTKQRVSKIIDDLKAVKKSTQNYVIKKITPGVNFKAAFTDFNNADDLIDNSYLSSSEYTALKNVVARAIKNKKHLLGYKADDKYEAYTTKGETNSGGSSSFSTIWDNLSDPYTKLQNLLGQARITEDENNYYVEDEYDFNNAGRLQNPYEGIVKNPTPYNVVRSFGTAQGAAPGAGRKVKLTIPKAELK